MLAGRGRDRLSGKLGNDLLIDGPDRDGFNGGKATDSGVYRGVARYGNEDFSRRHCERFPAA